MRGLAVRQDRNIVSEAHNILFGITPKAGCTMATKIFFNHIGRLDEALSYHSWIHRYRQKYIAEHPTSFAHLRSDSMLKLKFIRNPYTRAVSSYIHAMKHPYEKERIESFFDIGDFRAISFLQFIEYLESLPIAYCNGHHALQWVPGEGQLFKYDFLVRIEHLEEDLKVAADKGGVTLKIEDALLSSSHHLKKNTSTEFVGRTPFLDLSSGHEKLTEIPSYGAFYDDETRQRIEKVYQRDFRVYPYDRQVPG
jgi:hypothetical protein